MANTLGNYNPIFYANEALIWLQKALGMAQRVHMGYDAERRSAQQGQTISIRRPSTFTAQKGSITSQDLNTQVVDITLDQRPEVRFELTDIELAYTGEQVVREHISPAAYALADQIDQDLAALYKDVPWLYDYGSATDHAVITGLYKKAFDNKVPTRDGLLHLQVDGTLQMGFQNSTTFHSSQVTGPGQNDTLFNGTLGNRFGVEVFPNQNAPTHTVGTVVSGADQAGALNGAAALGATSIVVDAFAVGGETLKAGDTFSIAGNTQNYAVTADVTLTGGAGTIQFTPPLVQAHADNDVVTVNVQATGAVQQLLFHRNAFALAFAPLPRNLPGIDVSVATDPVTGLSVRASRWADGVNKKTYISLDALYGVKTLDPNLAVRGWT